MRWGPNEFHYLSQVIFSSEDNRMIFASGFTNPSVWLFELLAQPILLAFSFEVGSAILRLGGFFLLSVGLAFLVPATRVGILATALSVAVFLWADQAYFGGEWILRGIEAKIPAYAFGFAATGLALRGQQRTGWVLVIAATAFHPLVGLIFLVVLAVGEVLSWWRGEKRGLRWPISVSFLVLTYLGGIRYATLAQSEESSDFARRVYSLVRHPGHVAPFGGVSPIDGGAIPGWFSAHDLVLPVLLSTALTVVYLFTQNSLARRLATLALVLNAWVPISLLLAWIDRENQLLGPLYIFRPMSFILLLSLVAVFLGFFEFVSGFGRSLLLSLFFVFMLWGFLLNTKVLDVAQIPRVSELTTAGKQVVQMVKSNVGPTETVFADFNEIGRATGLSDQNFEILTERGQIAIWKFVPTKDADIILWWETMANREALLSGDCAGVKRLDWDFALVPWDESLIEAEVDLVESIQGIALIQLNDMPSENICLFFDSELVQGG